MNDVVTGWLIICLMWLQSLVFFINLLYSVQCALLLLQLIIARSIITINHCSLTDGFMVWHIFFNLQYMDEDCW